MTYAVYKTFLYHELLYFCGGIKGPGINVSLYLTCIRNKYFFNIKQSKSRSFKVRRPLNKFLENILLK